MGRFNIVERRIERFLREPASVRNAAGVIVVATTAVVVGGGVLINIIDNEEYPRRRRRDVVGAPDRHDGRVRRRHAEPRQRQARRSGAHALGTAFVAIVTAVITSTFVARASRDYYAAQMKDLLSDRDFMATRFDELERKLDRLEPNEAPEP